ncbi:MAG TPA: ribulokinase [Armatimonadota bacterium]|nr:ribulokinase [Armatimonadota bacterium]
MAEGKFALGIDFGTNSVRALIADVETGEEVGTYVHDYIRGRDGIILDDSDANFARQDPLEYIEGLEASVIGAVRDAEAVPEFSADRIIGIGVDTTGSTPMPVDADGVPLALHDEFRDNPNAMAWLWKDHTSFQEAELINRKAKEHVPDYTKYCGGIYSSEWYFSKILHLANVDPKAYNAAAGFVEHCDWMPALLVGDTDPKRILRSRCAAGHKAMWNAEWGGLPSQGFLSSVSPKLDGLISKLCKDSHTSDTKVGGLCAKWAQQLGLRQGIAVAVGAFDAHMGAVGAGIKPGTLVKIMGTSTCDMMVVPPAELQTQIKGICGQVDGSMVPGMIGLEAGQSAVGDIFAWYRDQMRWPIENLLPQSSISSAVAGDKLDALMEEAKGLAFETMTQRAQRSKPGQSGLLSLDWLNGNRTVLVDPNLTGLIVGLTLGTKPEEIFMALIEGTAFGGRVIMERIQEYGVKVEDVIACGGLAERNPFLMQIYADVTGRPMRISRSAQTCALGSAMFGAVAAGYYSKVEEAQAAMSGLKDIVYMPNPANRHVYDRLYGLYRRLHDAFGTKGFNESLYGVMKELLEIKRSAVNG